MQALRTVTRRSFLTRVAAGALLAGIGIGASEAAARRRAPVRMAVDSDPRDPARPLDAPPSPPTSRRGRVRTGYSDRDAGPSADPPDYGRNRRRRRSGVSDSDSGPGADPLGQGGRTPVQRFIVCPGNARCPRRR